MMAINRGHATGCFIVHTYLYRIEELDCLFNFEEVINEKHQSLIQCSTAEIRQEKEI